MGISNLIMNSRATHFIIFIAFCLSSADCLRCYTCSRGGQDCEAGVSEETCFNSQFCLKVAHSERDVPEVQKCFNPTTDVKYGPPLYEGCAETSEWSGTKSACLCSDNLCNGSPSSHS